MKLNELSSPVGTRTEPKRKGRGIGTGNGKTAGKGHKGQQARSGGGVRPGFEGGQMPIARRLPKRGFHNINAKEYMEISLTKLNAFEDGTVVNCELLKTAGIIKKCRDGVVILGTGELTKKLTVQASRFTKTAEEKIVAVGGKVEVV